MWELKNEEGGESLRIMNRMAPEHIWLLAGYAGAGKDTTAALLAQLLGDKEVTKNSFAGYVKDEVAAMYEFDRTYLDTQEGKARKITFPDGKVTTIRDLLIGHAEATKHETGNPAVWAERIPIPNTTHWILSDWRFRAELECLRQRCPSAAIHTVRILRNELETSTSYTEHQLDRYPCQYTIENIGSLLYLGTQVEALVKRVLCLPA